MLMRERDWYREWYRTHVGHPPGGPTLWEREHWARRAAKGRRSTFRPLRRVLGWLVLAAALAFLWRMGYYVSQGLDLADAAAAVRFDWAYYGELFLP